MKKIFYFLILMCFSQAVRAQEGFIKKLIHRYLSNDIDTTRKTTFVPIPVFSYAQESGFVYGAGVLGSFYANKNDKTNRSSNIYIAGSASTKNQYSFTYNGDFWTKYNGFHIINIIQYRKFSNNFYGIGNHTRRANAVSLAQNQLITSLQVEKRWAPYIYAGPTLGFENYHFQPDESNPIWHNPDIKGKNGGKAVYIGLASSFDDRDDSNYPTKGMYHRLTLQYAPNFFKGDNYTGLLSKLNLRAYQALNPKLVLAANLQWNMITGNNVPFYFMQPLGGEVLMRGYYSGRFRDKNMVGWQGEARYRFMKLFSVVGFVGAGEVFNQSFKFKELKPNYGAGIRYFFDINKGLNIRLDYGFGQKLPGEPRQSGFYFSMGEAF